MLFAHHASVVFNAAGLRKKSGESFTTADLLIPWVAKDEPEATPEAVMVLLRSKRKD